jgi:hypothetical protein
VILRYGRRKRTLEVDADISIGAGSGDGVPPDGTAQLAGALRGVELARRFDPPKGRQ